MKFTVAWAEVLSENVALKFIITILAICLITLGITTTKLALKDPLVIERTCFSSVAKTGSQERTPQEIEAFIATVLIQRFDSGSEPLPEFIGAEEQGFRRQEQEKLKLSQMTQKIVVNKVTLDGDKILVDSDRLLTVGEVKAAVRFPLSVSIATTRRTEGNPFGLVLVKVSDIKENAKAKP